MEPKIIEHIDEVNRRLRSALAVADLLTCLNGASLLDTTLPDIGTSLVHDIEKALSTMKSLHSLLDTSREDDPQ